LVWQYTDNHGTVVDSAGANPTVEITEVPLEAAGNSGYQYDPLTMTWQFNWDTSDFGPGTYNLFIESAQSGQDNGSFPIKLR
jgi:hypothetical protein